MSTNADTGNPRTTRPTTFHADDGQVLEEYRSLSLLAIASLIVGLAAPLCFAAPLMMVLPLIGAVFALIALRQIATGDGRVAGRWAALAGLALCLASFLALVSYGQMTRLLRERQAKKFGLAWIESLLAGDTERAFRLTAAGAQPWRSSAEPGAVPTNPYDTFIAHPLVLGLTTYDAGGQVRLVDTISYERQSPENCVIRQSFIVTPNAAQETNPESRPQPFVANLELHRARLAGESQPRWLVVDYEGGPENPVISSGQ